VAPRFTKLPLTAHTLASGVKGPRPITEDLASGGEEPRPIVLSASGVYRTEAISFIYVPKSREPSLFIIFSLAKRSPTVPSVRRPLHRPLYRRLRLRPRSLGRRSCSATEQQAKRRQPPSRHR